MTDTSASACGNPTDTPAPDIPGPAPLVNDGDGESGSRGGTAKWMVTFGDSLTLLLTFFVLIYTFSQPEPQTMAVLTRMLSRRRSAGGVQDAAQSSTNLVAERRLLLSFRGNAAGAEKPPLYKKLARGESEQFPPGLEIDYLEEFGEVLCFRIPLERLFAENEKTLSQTGAALLEKVEKVTALRPCTVVVSVKPREESSRGPVVVAELAVPVVRCLRKSVQSKFVSYRIGREVQLGDSNLDHGYCEILILAD